MTLHIQSAVPSSQTAVTRLAATGHADLAALLTRLYVPQYLLSIATLPCVIVIAIRLIGEGP